MVSVSLFLVLYYTETTSFLVQLCGHFKYVGGGVSKLVHRGALNFFKTLRGKKKKKKKKN
jgi:hypothetical protein